MEICFVLLLAGLILFGIGYAYGHIRDLELALQKQGCGTRVIAALRIQHDLDQSRIARLEVELEALKMPTESE